MSEKTACIYVSEAHEHFNFENIQGLTQKAAEINQEHGITGYLFYHRKMFLQYFEGSGGKPEQLMHNIETDKRHHVLRKVVDKNLKHYRFLSWHMRNLGFDELQEINFEKIMIDHMLRFANAEESTESTTKRIWKMADTISNKQWQFSE